MVTWPATTRVFLPTTKGGRGERAWERGCHFSPLGVNEWKLQVRSCPDQVLFYPVEKEISFKTGAHGLFNTYKDVRHLQNVTAVRKNPRLQTNLLGGLLYCLVLDKDPISQKFKPFVSARVAEIQESVEVDDFRYVRSKSNPADTLTRGTEPSRLTDWLEGPSFFQLPEAEWPSFWAEDQSILEEEAEVLKEMKTSEKADTSQNRKQP